MFPDGGGNLEELLSNADAAMYRAKQAGGNRYAFHDGQVAMAQLRQQTLEIELARAVQNSEMRVAYQPLVDAATLRPVRAEALLRWHDRKGPVAGPDVFVPLLERSGETVGQYEILRDEGCDVIQGYLFGKPSFDWSPHTWQPAPALMEASQEPSLESVRTAQR